MMDWPNLFMSLGIMFAYSMRPSHSMRPSLPLHPLLATNPTIVLASTPTWLLQAAFGTCSEPVPARPGTADKRWSATVDVTHLQPYILSAAASPSAAGSSGGGARDAGEGDAGGGSAELPTRFRLDNVLSNMYNVPIWASAALEVHYLPPHRVPGARKAVAGGPRQGFVLPPVPQAPQASYADNDRGDAGVGGVALGDSPAEDVAGTKGGVAPAVGTAVDVPAESAEVHNRAGLVNGDVSARGSASVEGAMEVKGDVAPAGAAAADGRVAADGGVSPVDKAVPAAYGDPMPAIGAAATDGVAAQHGEAAQYAKAAEGAVAPAGAAPAVERAVAPADGDAADGAVASQGSSSTSGGAADQAAAAAADGPVGTAAGAAPEGPAASDPSVHIAGQSSPVKAGGVSARRLAERRAAKRRARAAAAAAPRATAEDGPLAPAAADVPDEVVPLVPQNAQGVPDSDSLAVLEGTGDRWVQVAPHISRARE